MNTHDFLQRIGRLIPGDLAFLKTGVEALKHQHRRFESDRGCLGIGFTEHVIDQHFASVIYRSDWNLIDQQDTGQLIKLTPDHPASQHDIVPFLNTEIKIEP